MSKHFVITVDTEGDDLWKAYQSESGYRTITTKNALFLPDFQNLCEKYNFKPTYLTNYEMAIDDSFRAMAEKGLKDRKLEIGMHMHAWNTPPMYDLEYNPKGHNPFAGDYPYETISAKIKYLTELLRENFQGEITSHRGGRWYLDKDISKLLEENGYIVDCSITPGISWKRTIGNHIYGPDYKWEKAQISKLSGSRFAYKDCSLLEIPPTVIRTPLLATGLPKNSLELKLRLANNVIWLRPNGHNVKDLIYIVKEKSKDKEYLEFMIHSSELMPGGSPNFKTEASIKKLYSDMDILFKFIMDNGYEGICLSDFAKILNK